MSGGMTIRELEVAQGTVDESIIAAALEAARVYPYLKILCPWCRESVMGEVFAEHAKGHGPPGGAE